jgi:hypothetical protein
MNWLNSKTSLYNSHLDLVGYTTTFGDIINSTYYLPAINKIRQLDRDAPGYDADKKKLKSELACFALNELKYRKEIVSRSGLVQFDFDFEAIKDYDLDELMQALFDLPFIAYCGRSCSGDGFYALAMIAEPDKQAQYVEHCFEIFQKYNIPPDTSKGRNANDLRYVSYDTKMLIRDHPIPLRIKRFNAPKIKPVHNRSFQLNNKNGLVKWAVEQISMAQPGQRFETVRKTSYTMGGHGSGLEEMKNAIMNCSQYAGVEQKYLAHVVDGHMAGSLKPISA